MKSLVPVAVCVSVLTRFPLCGPKRRMQVEPQTSVDHLSIGSGAWLLVGKEASSNSPQPHDRSS